jgi:plastocyanin
MYFPSGKEIGSIRKSHMKLHTKFALIFYCAAVLPLLSSKAATFQVQIAPGGALTFSPSSVTIHVGDTVQWTWASSGHSSTSGTPGHPDGLWDSGVQNVGFVFSHTFDTAGTFAYYCTPHGLCCGMVGSVMVTAATDTVQITRALYTTSRSQLTVQATDSDPTAVLTVSVTSSGAILGNMTNKGGGSYSAKFNGIANPLNITVSSNLGGTASARVRAR